MFQIAKPVFFICETPLHAGAGGGVGTELPIQREAHTQFPKMEASGIKGAIREAFERRYAGQKKAKTDADLVALFGHPENGDENAGALGLTDGRLLLFPVRSRRAVFAWVTCPRVLNRFIRDLAVSMGSGGGEKVQQLLDVANAVSKTTASVAPKSALAQNGLILLEEYSIAVKETPETEQLALSLSGILQIPELSSQFAIVPDDYFSDFVQHCTEFHTRIRIGDEGVVEGGALFTEEHLPAESVLYGLAMAHPELKKGGKDATALFTLFHTQLPDIVQMGGNATLGKGIIRLAKTLFAHA